MASDLISRDAVLGLLEDRWYGRKGTTNPFDMAICDVLESIIDEVKYEKAVDAEPVRHGKWIVERRSKFPFDGVSIKCSLCGRYEYKKEPYCHCGAKMDGGKQDG